MKKQLIAVSLIFVFLLIVTGCSAANAVQKLDAVEDRAEAKLEAVEEKVEDSFQKAVSPNPAQPQPEAPPAVAEDSRTLTEDQILQIALDHLGVAADQVTRLRTEYEIDDGIPQFDVEFRQGDWEHEFEIHAKTGHIISYDQDHKYD